MFKSLFTYSLLVLLSVLSGQVLSSQTLTLENGEVLQDPTKPEAWSVPQSSRQASVETSFELNYIVVSAGQKRAMINGKKVHEGEFVSGAQVKRITQGSVYLIYKGMPKELRINKVNGIQRN